MMLRSLTKAFLVIIRLLSSDLEFGEMAVLGVKAMESAEAAVKSRNLFHNIDGCTCYSNEDCKNTPGCGSYCSWGIIVGFCRHYGIDEISYADHLVYTA